MYDDMPTDRRPDNRPRPTAYGLRPGAQPAIDLDFSDVRPHTMSAKVWKYHWALVSEVARRHGLSGATWLRRLVLTAAADELGVRLPDYSQLEASHADRAARGRSRSETVLAAAAKMHGQSVEAFVQDAALARAEAVLRGDVGAVARLEPRKRAKR